MMRCRAAGFTLLEILLALALFAMLMVGVWGVMTGASRITRSADALMAQAGQVRAVQHFLRGYVGAAVPLAYATGTRTPTRVFRGNATSMQYVAPLPAQSGHSGLYLQTLSLVKADSGTALWLAYRPYAGGVATDVQPARQLLLANLRGGGFQYLAATAFKQPGRWRGAWQSTTGLPLAVRIRLAPAWRTRVAFPDMVIRLHAGSGLGARQGAP